MIRALIRVLPIINTRLCAYAPLPSSVSALRAFALLLQNTVGPRAKKFNLVRNDHGPTQRYEFSSDSNGSRNLRYGACFKQTIECRFTLKLVREMIIKYSECEF